MEFASSFMGLGFLVDNEFFFSQMAFHDFCIRFSLSFGIIGATSLARELHSHTKNPWSHMFYGRELYLELGFWRYSMESKYLENEIYTIPCLHLGLFFSEMFIYIPDLCWFHDVPDDKEFCTKFISDEYEFIEFPATDEGSVIGRSSFLYSLHDGNSSIG